LICNAFCSVSAPASMQAPSTVPPSPGGEPNAASTPSASPAAAQPSDLRTSPGPGAKWRQGDLETAHAEGLGDVDLGGGQLRLDQRLIQRLGRAADAFIDAGELE
jgi:hypothetical protein